ncbi:MAG: FliH/SctL family protein [Phycisphaerae bacterium]
MSDGGPNETGGGAAAAAPATPAIPTARVVRSASARVEPLYPASRLLRGAVFEAEAALADAARVLAEARVEGDRIRAAAVADAGRVRDEAFAFGAEQAAAETAQLMRNLQAELDGLKAQFARDVQRLAFKIAKVVLGAEIDAKPERIVSLVAAVLDRAKMYERVVLRLHPGDVDRVRPHMAALTSGLAFAENVTLVGDDDLPPHGVRVETEMGSFDGSIDTQLRRLEVHLMGERPGIAGGDGGAAKPAGGTE